MVTRIGGARRRTRQLFKKGLRTKGKISITKYLQNLNVNDKVVLKVDSSVQDGVYPSKFHGRVATVTGKRGRCFVVALKEGRMNKSLIVHPVHLIKK